MAREITSVLITVGDLHTEKGDQMLDLLMEKIRKPITSCNPFRSSAPSELEELRGRVEAERKKSGSPHLENSSMPWHDRMGRCMEPEKAVNST